MNSYKNFDETYLIFDRILKKYVSLVNEGENIMVNEEDTMHFNNLMMEYEESKSEISNEWNFEKRLADSLVFWLNVGLISINNGNYYINSDELNKRNNQYEEFKQNKSTGSSIILRKAKK